ncbi:phosphate signaling complex protein PhoU [Thomasclavelia spiroformis]|uniref:phosphate signaling complex protein PhoU n=1 Tax=Thomasclavelia spiroformis TaxID=29348 RepID=UPI00255B52EE|nr:phosphate signaling complex protein PhoU [Thomasclavelia spiroformis]
MLRSNFEKDLNKLHVDLDKMCHLVILSIENCIAAFKSGDRDLCRDILAGDKVINDMERTIEARCLSLILKQQPIASDLRNVSTALKVVTDLERIGDQGADIAEILLETDVKSPYKMVEHIPNMAILARDMVKGAIEAFHEHDLKKTKEIKKMEDKMDGLFEEVKVELVQIVKEAADNIDIVINFLMIAKYFERIGDHAVNICEWVEFNQTGTVDNYRLI